MRALLLRQIDDGLRAAVEDVPEADLPDGEVLVNVAFSGLNYKDGLAVTGKGRIVRGAFPFVPGIDLAGTVAESRSPEFQPGDEVILTGWGTGEERWGGFAQRARASAAHLVRLPGGMTLQQAMFVGTAGFTAQLAAMALSEGGVVPGNGPVCVTGASGGVGSVAVALLARAGYEVHAVTGTAEAHAYLRRLGAAEVLGRDALGEPPQKGLGPGRWAGAVDAVGGAPLAALFATTRRHGVVAVCGNAASAELHTTVFPFILRGVTLYGVETNTTPAARRQAAWSRLADALRAGALDAVEETIVGLDDVPTWAEKMTRGETMGRVVVEVGVGG